MRKKVQNEKHASKGFTDQNKTKIKLNAHQQSKNIEKAIDFVCKKSQNKKMFIKRESAMLQNVKKESLPFSSRNKIPKQNAPEMKRDDRKS